MDPRFSHIRDWIFDLDNCLYPASSNLFELIDERMTAYIERLLDIGPEEARRVYGNCRAMCDHRGTVTCPNGRVQSWQNPKC